MWHLDFVTRYINRANTFTLILLDDYSRFVVGYAVSESERADAVIGAFEDAVQRYGKPESVMTDRGSAFWSWRGIGKFTAGPRPLMVAQSPAPPRRSWAGARSGSEDRAGHD
jgi:transposase InsO family protein